MPRLVQWGITSNSVCFVSFSQRPLLGVCQLVLEIFRGRKNEILIMNYALHPYLQPTLGDWKMFGEAHKDCPH